MVSIIWSVCFAAGYMELGDVFKFGLVMGVVNLVIWGAVGAFWWNFLGLY